MQLYGSLVLAAAAPTVRLYEGFNQALNVINTGNVSKGGSVRFLESAGSVEECRSTCIQSTPRCWSFVYLNDAECYAVTSPGFNPSFDLTATSGVVQWPCRDDGDCSLNGQCDVVAGKCACR